MDGIKDFRKFQLGREVKNGGNPGTKVAASALMRGVWIGSDETPIKYPQENLGLKLETTRGYKPYTLGTIKQGPDPLTFEQLGYVLAAAIRGIEKGAADGVGSGKIYHYPWPTKEADYLLVSQTISFVATTKTISDTANKLGFLQANDLIKISGAGVAGNNGIFSVASAEAGSVVVNETIVDESVGATVSIEVLTQTYTAEGGNNVRVDSSGYSFPTSFEISGKGGADMDALMLSSSWTTRQWEKAVGFTSGLAIPAVSEALFCGARLFIDSIGGVIGTTEVPDTMASFGYKANTGLGHQFSGSGNLFFSKAHRKGKTQITCAIALYMNAAALLEYDAWLAGTPRLIRIKIDGPTLATAGTLYSRKSLILDMPGTWSNFPSPDDIEGAEVLSGTFRPAYDPTAGIGPSITLVNELVQLP